MGRAKGAKNKSPSVKVTSPVQKKTRMAKIIKEEPTLHTELVLESAPLETPLFMCRRCQLAFETQDEYSHHPCQAQVYNVVENPESKIDIEITVEQQEEEAAEEVEVVSPKKPRKPYKKREKKEVIGSSSKEPVKCPTCDKSFTRKYHLERHLVHTSCNPGNIQRDEFSCEVCNKVFSRVDNLRMHLRAHLGQKSRSRDFQCPYCEKSFYGSSLLNIHVRTHTREKPYKCTWVDCGKGFPSSGALTKHTRVHTGERPYSCPMCDNRFAAKETLNRHVRTHTGRKDHKCLICGKEFIQNTQLRAHMFYHNGENALVCDLCGKQFNRKTRLREHLEYIHLMKKMPTCVMCSKKFMRREDLNRHVETHIGERIHACCYCDKKFVTKAAVRIHARIHQTEEPARCSYCNKNFLRMDCLVRHMRARHREMLQQIIVEAETKKIINAMNPSDNEEIEIIYYKEESQMADAVEVYEVVPLKGDEEEDGDPIFLGDELLKARIAELLQIVIEEGLLKELGFGKKPIDEVLCAVLEQCSRKPLKLEKGCDDDSTRMRENTKQLFSMVLDEDHIKELLNNYTVDEVITIVLRMSK